MISAPTTPPQVQTSSPALAHRLPARRLPAKAAFALQVSILVCFLAGSSAPTPLYGIYQAQWGFTPITVTVIFAVYAVAVLAALLTVGALSDHIGRRPVLLTAVAVQAVVMLLFATADGVPALILARVLQGLSTGAALGALGAGMLDLNKATGTIANAVSGPAGTATGAIGSSLLIQFLPSPTHLVYVVLFTIFVLQGIGVLAMRESSSRRPGAFASLRPRFALPRAARRPLIVAAPALVAAWALAGFYGALGPTLVGLVTGSSSVVLGGLSLFVLAAAGSLTVLVARHAAPRPVMFLGTLALAAGVGLTLLAVTGHSATAFFVGTAIAGVGFGGAFQGALRTIVPLAKEHERAGVLSIIYLISYLAMGLPAVLAGYLVVHSGGVIVTAQEYGAAVIALAAVAFVGLLWRAERAHSVGVATPCHTAAK
jgi:MFS family permease